MRPLPLHRSVAASSRISRLGIRPLLTTFYTPTTLPRRLYSTSPNQHQVLQSFGTPFAQFVYTISRIARIITFTALGAGTIGLVSFEAAHQYVEHIALPSSSPTPSSSDEYGWLEQSLDESWSGSLHHKGTDPRLGVKGRHAVRSAWMCVNWGGGIAPSVLFGGSAAGNAGLGRTAITSMAGAKTLRVDDGMILAMQYLNVAKRIAAQKGIKLPDTDAIRAGLASSGEGVKDVDPLAIALEQRLASVKERQGSSGALDSAIASYEKLWDIASFSAGGDVERKVRLATKLGDLYAARNKKEEAQEWLDRAVNIAATAGAAAPTSPSPSPFSSSTSKSSVFSRWFSPSPSPSLTPTPTTATKTEPTASPALTRTLFSALISTSALTAQSGSLPQALQTQFSAIQLCDAELARLSPSPSTSGELHKLWMQQHQAVLELHVAETIYALATAGGGGGKQPIDWIDQAKTRAEAVVQELTAGAGEGAGSGKGGNQKEELAVAEKWQKQNEVKVVAARVLRDAKRVIETAERSRRTLEAK